MTADWMVVHGRFQPFHLGHLEYLSLALQRSDKVIVGITNPDVSIIVREATADHRHLPNMNPFTYFERAEMIAESLSEADGSDHATVRIVPLDVSRCETWFNYLPGRCRQLVTVNEEWDEEKARRFTDAGYLVETVCGNPSRITATLIRSLIRRNDESWRRLVPRGTSKVIDSLGRARLDALIEENSL